MTSSTTSRSDRWVRKAARPRAHRTSDLAARGCRAGGSSSVVLRLTAGGRRLRLFVGLLAGRLAGHPLPRVHHVAAVAEGGETHDVVDDLEIGPMGPEGGAPARTQDIRPSSARLPSRRVVIGRPPPHRRGPSPASFRRPSRRTPRGPPTPPRPPRGRGR